MQAGIFYQVSADDLAGYYLMSDVLGSNDQKDGADGEDRVYVKLCELEVGSGEECHAVERRKIHQTKDAGGNVTADHGDQQGDHGEELAEKYEVLKSVLYGRTRITLLTPAK